MSGGPAPWDADHELTAEEIARLLAEHAPDLAGRELAPLGEGWDFWTFEAAGEVLRFPKRAGVASLMDREAALVNAVAPSLPLRVPRPAVVASRFMRYAKVPGVPLGPRVVAAERARAIALSMGEAVSALHAFPRERAVALGAPDTGWERAAPRARRALARLRGVALRLPREVVARAERCLTDALPPEGAGPTTLTHSDLRAEHLLVDPASLELTGVIDWGDAQLGDPAVDFLGAWELGGDDALSAALSRYEHPWADAFAARSRLFGACHAVFDAWYAIERDMPRYLAPAIASLGRL